MPGAGALLGGEEGEEAGESAEAGGEVAATDEEAASSGEPPAKEKLSGGEKLFDVLNLLKMPSQQDLQDLRLQLAILNQRLDELLASRAAEASDSSTTDDDPAV